MPKQLMHCIKCQGEHCLCGEITEVRMLVKGAPFGCVLLTAERSQKLGC